MKETATLAYPCSKSAGESTQVPGALTTHYILSLNLEPTNPCTRSRYRWGKMREVGEERASVHTISNKKNKTGFRLVPDQSICSISLDGCLHARQSISNV